METNKKFVEFSNICQWLPIGKTQRCGNKCKDQYCIIHMANIKRGSTGPQPCIVCNVGVRGKSPLCVAHGAKKYRTLKLYYDTHQNINHRGVVIKSPHDYVNKKSKDFQQSVKSS